MSRDITKMHPALHEKWALWHNGMKKAGLKYVITSVDRTVLEQMALFVQGRLSLRQVNTFRRIAELSRITEKRNRIVTWTLDSAHVTNMFDDNLNNDFSRAFDFALLKGSGAAHWDIKASVNENEIPDYNEAGAIARDVGLIWGGPYGDYCHCEVAIKPGRGEQFQAAV